MTRRRRGTLAMLVAVVTFGSLVGWYWWDDRRLPRYEGRTVRAWFQELCRHESGWNYRDEARVWECKTALVRLGTNAVPYLLQEALRVPHDTALRTNLHTWFGRMPAWMGGGRFVPPSMVVQQAEWALRNLRPPPEMVLPELGTRLSTTNAFEYRQAILLLGGVREATPPVLEALIPAFTNTADPWLSSLAFQSLQWLGVSASNALPFATARLAEGPPHPGIYRWLAELGPLADAAIPVIEAGLTSTNDWVRLNAAGALLAIRPEHSESRRMVYNAVRSAEIRAPADPRAVGVRRSALDNLVHVLSYWKRRPDPGLAALFEPLARAEIEAWNPRWASFRSTSVLDRHAPDRAAALYRDALEGPAATYAAGCLLRLERTNTVAAAKLMEIVDRKVPESVSAVWWLAEASSTVPGLTNYLAARAAEPLRKGGGIVSRHVAAAALARIRYREARVVVGLSETE